METAPIYLDHSATTAVEPRVIEAMMPYLQGTYGNPNSVHLLGQRAHQAVEQSRRTVAAILGCRPREIVFTSCGTESDNLAIRGIAAASDLPRRHLITTPVEHQAVLATMRQLAAAPDVELTLLPVDQHGQVRARDVADALRPETVLVSVMYANNEVGTIQPIAEIGALLADHPAAFHVDAVQAGGYLPLDVDTLGVDALALSGHKFHAPKGVGLLYLRGGTPYRSPMTGASQERNRRAGTLNVAFIVAIAAALEIAQSDRERKNAHLLRLRTRLIDGVLAGVPGAALTGHPTARLPGHASFVMGEGLEADAMLLALDMAGIAASSGSACTSGQARTSHVLDAMDIPYLLGLSALRLTLGDDNSESEIEQVVERLPRVIARLTNYATSR